MKLRRKEYKRKRWYKRRETRRHPMYRLLKQLYADMRQHIVFPIVTPLLTSLRRGMQDDDLVVHANTVYFDVVTRPQGALSGSQTTRATAGESQSTAEPVNYDDSGRALSRFYRNPFLRDS